jgi:hypothetical protein
MKSTKYILLSVLFLSIFSCQKEVISPCGSSHDRVAPEWNPKMINEIGSSSNDEAEIDDAGLEGEITDPNNDPDSVKKKGGKK